MQTLFSMLDWLYYSLLSYTLVMLIKREQVVLRLDECSPIPPTKNQLSKMMMFSGRVDYAIKAVLHYDQYMQYDFGESQE